MTIAKRGSGDIAPSERMSRETDSVRRLMEAEVARLDAEIVQTLAEQRAYRAMPPQDLAPYRGPVEDTDR